MHGVPARDVAVNDAADLRTELNRLRADLDQVRTENAALRARVDSTGSGEVAQAGEHRSTRRGMLRLAGAAAAGAAAAAVSGSQHAAALNGAGLTIGESQTATRTTLLSYGTAPNVVGDLVGAFPSAMLQVETNFSNSVAITAIGSLYGVIANGTEGGVIGFNGQYNYVAGSCSKAALLLRDVTSITQAPKTPPPTRTDVHVRGEIECDLNGDLWWCHADGIPGKWKKIAGSNAAGSLHAITPVRVYDSRAGSPAPGFLSGGSNRVVSIKDARPDATGAVSIVDVVPTGSTAIAYNLTVADTIGAGFLSVTEGDAGGFTASSINWSATGQLLANGSVVKVDANRQVRVFAGGAGNTNFIIDVVGYYL